MTSLVGQCLRIPLPMRETRVQSLIWEDPTCRGATKPNSAQLLQSKPMLPNQSSHHMEKFSTEMREQPPRPTTREKPAQQRRPSIAKNKQIIFFKVGGWSIPCWSRG